MRGQEPTTQSKQEQNTKQTTTNTPQQHQTSNHQVPDQIDENVKQGETGSRSHYI